MEYYRQRFDDYLRENWPVSIGTIPFDTAEIFKKLAEDDYEATFSEWAQGERQQSLERAREFLNETGCLERFETLLDRAQAGQIVPFVGAGMSVPSGFPTWASLLRSLMTDAPDRQEELDKLIDSGAYEEAAQLVLEQLGQHAFDEEIRNRLGNRRRRPVGPVRLLPHLFAGELLTTNLDPILKAVYFDEGLPFAGDLSGTALREALVRLAGDPHCLLRLHGEADSNLGRVLTLDEYNRAYHADRTLAALLGEICGPRSILFLGCSLNSDRIVQALREIKAASSLERPPHYAFLPLSSVLDRASRRRELSEAGIHPIYYPEDEHDQCIEDMLIALMEGSL